MSSTQLLDSMRLLDVAGGWVCVIFSKEWNDAVCLLFGARNLLLYRNYRSDEKGNWFWDVFRLSGCRVMFHDFSRSGRGLPTKFR